MSRFSLTGLSKKAPWRPELHPRGIGGKFARKAMNGWKRGSHVYWERPQYAVEDYPGQFDVIEEPKLPTQRDLEVGVFKWKGDPGSLRFTFKDILGRYGMPPWAGGAWVDQRKEMAAILNAMGTLSEETDTTLYRGMEPMSKDKDSYMVRETDPAKVLDSFPEPGGRFDWAPSGFSTSSTVAAGFGDLNGRRLGLTITLEPGAMALPIDRLFPSGYETEDEHLVGGRFEVVEKRYDEKRNQVFVHIRQVYPIGMPDDGMGEWR